MKWDDHPAFAKGLGKTAGAKAVDFAVAQIAEDGVALVEVKDFHTYRIENKRKLPTRFAVPSRNS